jgi:hypothetical protein
MASEGSGVEARRQMLKFRLQSFGKAFRVGLGFLAQVAIILLSPVVRLGNQSNRLKSTAAPA